MIRGTIIFALIIFFSCRNVSHPAESTDERQLIENSDSSTSKVTWDSLKNMSVESLLKAVTKNSGHSGLDNIIVLDQSKTPNSWIKETDLATLLKLVKSKTPCKCIVSPFSSYIPNEAADLGGYAIRLLTNYKNGDDINFGLYSCPKSDDNKADELIRWLADFRTHRSN